MYSSRPVIVMQVPEQLKHAEVNTFLNELQPLLESDRPRLVMDCSQVQEMDSAGVAMFLHCMEETMKRDGDLKLAALSPAAAVILELMRVDRLFEVFETADQAVQGFQGFPLHVLPQTEPCYPGVYGALGDLKAAS
jgi:anti-sigma B factor antagonist